MLNRTKKRNKRINEKRFIISPKTGDIVMVKYIGKGKHKIRYFGPVIISKIGEDKSFSLKKKDVVKFTNIGINRIKITKMKLEDVATEEEINQQILINQGVEIDNNDDTKHEQLMKILLIKNEVNDDDFIIDEK